MNEPVRLAGPLHTIFTISITSFIYTHQLSSRMTYNSVATQLKDLFVTYIFFLAPFLPPLVSLLFLPTAMLNTESERGGNEEIPRELKRQREKTYLAGFRWPRCNAQVRCLVFTSSYNKPQYFRIISYLIIRTKAYTYTHNSSQIKTDIWISTGLLFALYQVSLNSCNKH